jgi:hypothetical protein
MKVKTFTGTDPSAVDKQVNDWLAENNVKARKTNIAFQRLRDRGTDALTGRTTSRSAIGIAISVWYEEPAASKRLPRGARSLRVEIFAFRSSLCSARKWSQLGMSFYILEGGFISTRSRDDNGRACKALQGSVPVPPSRLASCR